MKNLKFNKTKIAAMVMAGTLGLACLSGCATDASIVSKNLSAAADSFEVTRKLTYFNLRSNEVLFTVTGVMSIDVASNGKMDITMRIGEDEYVKHFIQLSDETTYVIEQVETNEVDKYHYEILWKPEVLIPSIRRQKRYNKASEKETFDEVQSEYRRLLSDGIPSQDVNAAMMKQHQVKSKAK